jgi:hypothetical protein
VEHDPCIVREMQQVNFWEWRWNGTTAREGGDGDMSKYRVKGWGEFQHYKDRRPPWIKLHRTLLDNRDYHMLSDGAGKALPLIWIMASDFGGEMPDNGTAAFRLRATEAEYHAVISELVERGFVEQVATHASEHVEQDATPSDAPVEQVATRQRRVRSKLLQTVKDDAIPETETETEKRQRESERETPATVGGEGTPDQKPRTEPPPPSNPVAPSKPIEPDDHPLVILAQKVRGCRPEYSAMTVAGILHHLRFFANHPHLERTVSEWCASHANAVEGYQMPLKSLAKALSTMAAAPTRARAFGE